MHLFVNKHIYKIFIEIKFYIVFFIYDSCSPDLNSHYGFQPVQNDLAVPEEDAYRNRSIDQS